MPDVIDFSADKEWTGRWNVSDANGKRLCTVKARTYDAALLKARNHPSTAGHVFIHVAKEEIPKTR